MSEEDMIFDPSLKKKKKKKKTPFDLDAAMGEGEGETVVAAPPEEPEDKPGNEVLPAPVEDGTEGKEAVEDFGLDDPDFAMTKKKKKKKKPFDLSELEESLPKEKPAAEEMPAMEEIEEVGEAPAADEDFDMSLPSKKKKKKKVKISVDEVDAADMPEEEAQLKESHTWSETDRDYTYDELLKRVIDIMMEKNPDMVAGEKKRFVMKPPQVMRVGTKKSSFCNFAEICKMLHRQPKHVLDFLLTEMGTSGSIDGSNQLIIKGKFQQKQIESVLRRYIKEYVTCHTCRSPDTILQKDTRLYFLQCETCGSRCSVASIKSGFQAVTGKRAAIRAKTA